MKPRQKFAVIGHTMHGKDTVCEILRDRFGLSFTSSSLFCAEKIVFPSYKSWCSGRFEPIVEKHMRWPASDPHWTTAVDCYEQRRLWRDLWFDLISDYNRPDPIALARAIIEEYDVYAGMRSRREFHAAVNEGLFDHILWVDRSDLLPEEPKSSMQLQPWMATFVIDNNSDLSSLHREVDRIMINRLGFTPVDRPDLEE